MTAFENIRKIFPELLALEICNVQPMCGGIGSFFSLRCNYKPRSLKEHILSNIEIMKRKPHHMEYDNVLTGYRRELNIFKQQDCIEFVRDQ